MCAVSIALSPLSLSQSFDRTFEDHDLQREIDRRMSGTFASSGLFSLNMSETEKAVDVTIDPAASYGCKFLGDLQLTRCTVYRNYFMRPKFRISGS